MATSRSCLAWCSDIGDLWRYGSETKHLHPLESSLLVVDDQRHDLTPFGSVSLDTTDHNDDFPLEVAIASRHAVLWNGREKQPSPCCIYFAEQEITTISGSRGIIAHENFYSAADLLAAGVV